MSTKTLVTALLGACVAFSSCDQVQEEDIIFHAGPVESGLSAIFFGLYKENKYRFCDGDFLDPGCYTGDYVLSGDTITLLKLRKHAGIPTNRFLIRRYSEMDSTYWRWKYPNDTGNWEDRKWSDYSIGWQGDVFPLNNKGEMVLDGNNYFIIRYDSLKRNH